MKLLLLLIASVSCVSAIRRPICHFLLRDYTNTFVEVMRKCPAGTSYCAARVSNATGLSSLVVDHYEYYCENERNITLNLQVPEAPNQGCYPFGPSGTEFVCFCHEDFCNNKENMEEVFLSFRKFVHLAPAVPHQVAAPPLQLPQHAHIPLHRPHPNTVLEVQPNIERRPIVPNVPDVVPMRPQGARNNVLNTVQRQGPLTTTQNSVGATVGSFNTAHGAIGTPNAVHSTVSYSGTQKGLISNEDAQNTQIVTPDAQTVPNTASKKRNLVDIDAVSTEATTDATKAATDSTEALTTRTTTQSATPLASDNIIGLENGILARPRKLAGNDARAVSPLPRPRQDGTVIHRRIIREANKNLRPFETKVKTQQIFLINDDSPKIKHG
ncbi:unnamed protein product [Bursaphelenchus okinawaensis]|uniref:Activin_recp domain-containing protein n=1 Tax=Bursaphelenchus okinawaensis TaxID=465554 RepID=A0A811LPE3_9BILA|nr:unnamed protein product [Bursaphelenchus okinawaensis]CAG9127127.1 unnamed protein product [Bursaphelenchus okinawaensis]